MQLQTSRLEVLVVQKEMVALRTALRRRASAARTIDLRSKRCSRSNAPEPPPTRVRRNPSYSNRIDCIDDYLGSIVLDNPPHHSLAKNFCDAHRRLPAINCFIVHREGVKLWHWMRLYGRLHGTRPHVTWIIIKERGTYLRARTSA